MSLSIRQNCCPQYRSFVSCLQNNDQTRSSLGRVCATGMYCSIVHVLFTNQTGIFLLKGKRPQNSKRAQKFHTDDTSLLLASTSDLSGCTGNLLQPIRSPTQIWVVTRHQPTFRDATTGFPSRKEHRNSLVTDDASLPRSAMDSTSDWSCRERLKETEALPQIWVVPRHQYGISALVSQK